MTVVAANEAMSDHAIDPLELRGAFGRFGTGVTIVGFEDGDEMAGITVNSFTSVSLSPALLLVSIQKSSRMHDRVLGKPFSVSVLSADQEQVARAFASKDRTGVPAWDISGRIGKVKEALAWFECDAWRQVDAGDHTLLVGEILDFGHGEGEPLMFYSGRMRSLA